MSMHKLAIVIVRNTDSLLMSSFIGLATVGIYSNYRLVLNALNNLMTKVVTAFPAAWATLRHWKTLTGCIRCIKKWIFSFLCCPAT